MAPSESQTQKLIGLYRSCECLWDPQSPGYHSVSVQDDAWRKITRGLNSGLTPDQVKLRMLALRNYYDRESAAMRRSQLEGKSYVPRQSYFKDLLFLGDAQCGETEESKASFCRGQLNCILEDSFILSDNNSIKSDYPLNYSETTFCQCSASLSESKPGYTLYKLILEPEKPSTSQEKEHGEVIGKSAERSTSGNDRWYPTTYCVRCHQDKAACSERGQSRYSESRSTISMQQNEACIPNREQDQESCSCSSEGESDVPPRMDSQRQRHSPRTHNNFRGNDEWPRPKLCGQARPEWTPKCRGAKKELGRDKSFCLSHWKRNNDAVCQRLQAQMDRQGAQMDRQGAQNKDGACSRRERVSKRTCSGEDQMNVMLLKNNCPRNGSPQNINCHTPADLAHSNNNQQIPEAGRYSQPCPGNYNNNQQMQDPGPFINNQQMQDPGRYSNSQPGQQMYPDTVCACYQMQPGHPNYYQAEQFAQSPTNFPYSGTPPNSVAHGQQYVETEYVPCQLVNEYGRSSYPEQPAIYCYPAENPNRWSGAMAPGQMSMMPPCLPCDFPDSRASAKCKAPCARSGPTDFNNRYSADSRRYSEQPTITRRSNGQQENDEGYSAADPRESSTQRQNQSQSRNTEDEQDMQRRRRSDFDRENVDQRRQSREVDREGSVPRSRNLDDVEGPVRRSHGYDDESPTQRIQRNRDPESRKCCEGSYCAFNRRHSNDYEESPAGGRQRTSENPDLNYENPPSQRRRISDDNADTSTKKSFETQTPPRTDRISKNPPPVRRKKRQDCQPYGQPMATNRFEESQNPEVFPMLDDESQLMYYECPAYSRQDPKDCPNSTYRQQDRGRQNRSRQDREERIAKKTRPPSRNREYEDDERPSSRSRGRPPPEEFDSEDEKISSPKGRAKCRPSEETKKPKRRSDDNYCKDERCKVTLRHNKDRIGRKNRQDWDEEKGYPKNKSLKREVKEAYCTDDTCPYIESSELGAIPKDISRRPNSNDFIYSSNKKKRGSCDDKSEPKRSSRNESSTRKNSRNSEDTNDIDRYNKIKKKKDVDDCECYSDNGNNYDQRRGSYDDEREPKRSSRDESSTRKNSRNSDDTKDIDRHKKIKSKKKDEDDCECYSDNENNYDQRRSRKDDRYYDEEPDESSPREKFNKYPRRDDRNEGNNERSQRGYQRANRNTSENIPDDYYDRYDDYIANRGNRNKNDSVDDCACGIDTYDAMRETKTRNSRGMKESPRNSQKNRDYEGFDYERQTRRSSSPKWKEEKLAPRKQWQTSRGTDVYESEYDCPCSGDECKKNDDRNPPQSRSPRRGSTDEREPNKDRQKDIQERSGENATDTDPMNSKRNTATSIQKMSSRKSENEQNNQEDATKNSIQERAEMDEDKDGNEYNQKPNKISVTKSDPVLEDCNCEPLSDPFDPNVSKSPKRNPAGNGNFILNEAPGSSINDLVVMETVRKPPSKTKGVRKPLEASNKFKWNASESNTAEPALPSKKKLANPGGSGPSKNTRSSRQKSRSASPTRSSVPPRTTAGEPVKRRAAPRCGASPSPSGRRYAQSGAKKTTDISAAPNSKLPFELNSASYFICKLQDDGNTHQYLVVVPKEPTGGPGRHREDPGQGSVKQLHCRRQCSGFQSVSWVNPASTYQSRPHHSMEDIFEQCSSVAPPDLTETMRLIVKEYLQRSYQGSHGLKEGIQPMAPPQRYLKTILTGPKRRKPVLRPCNIANASILAENRTVLLTNNPFQNMNLAENKEEVIVLHPPVPGFRPSKNSFNKDALEVQHLMVRNSDTDVNPRPTPAAPLLPPRPPTKPKRK